jgi:acylphosphatase
MENLHFDIKITGLQKKPGIKFRLMRMAELYHIAGYVSWGKDKVMKIEAEGKENELRQFLSSIRDVPGMDDPFQLNSKEGSMKGFREFSIVDY